MYCYVPRFQIAKSLKCPSVTIPPWCITHRSNSLSQQKEYHPLQPQKIWVILLKLHMKWWWSMVEAHLYIIRSHWKAIWNDAYTIPQWVDLRENLQETIDFPVKDRIFLYFFFLLNQSIEYLKKTLAPNFHRFSRPVPPQLGPQCFRPPRRRDHAHGGHWRQTAPGGPAVAEQDAGSGRAGARGKSGAVRKKPFCYYRKTIRKP